MGQVDEASATNAAHLHSLPCAPAQSLRTHAVGSSQVSTVLGEGTIWGQCHPINVTVHQSVPLELLQGVGVHQDLMHPLRGAVNRPCILSCHRVPSSGCCHILAWLSSLHFQCWLLPWQDKRTQHMPSSAACPPAPAQPCALAAMALWTAGARG